MRYFNKKKIPYVNNFELQVEYIGQILVILSKLRVFIIMNILYFGGNNQARNYLSAVILCEQADFISVIF